jgi:hypothetical protein
MLFEQFVDRVQDTALETLRSTGNVIPVCFVLSEDDTIDALPLAITGVENAPEVIQQFIASKNSVGYVLVTEAWTSEVPEHVRQLIKQGVMSTEDIPNPSEALNRKESVLILSQKKGGTAKQVTVEFKKSVSGIQLGETEKFDSVKGKFVDLI